MLFRSRDTPRARPNGESSWETAAAAVVAAAAVTWKLRLTFRPGNYIWRFSYGFGLLVRDLGKWRPGFYTEFRYRSHEHSGLAWGAIFKKYVFWSYFQNYHVHFSRNKFSKCVFPNVPTRKEHGDTFKYIYICIYIYKYIYLTWARDGRAGGGRAGAHVRYMYLYMYMHM